LSDRRRQYRVVGDFGPNVGAISITIDDEIGPKLRQMMRENPSIASRALRHTGWFIQKDMKQAMTTGRGTERQSLLSKRVERRFRSRVTDKATLKKHIRHPLRWMGSRLSKHRRMARAIGYEMRSDKSVLRVGWLSKSSVKWAKEYQDGKTLPVTPKMRKHFAAIGIPLRKGRTVIRTKPDRFIPNWFRTNNAKLVKVFSDRFVLKFNEMMRRRIA
jgi:hypothetical protein